MPKNQKTSQLIHIQMCPDKFVITLAVSYINSYTFKFLVCQCLTFRLEHLNILIVCI